VTIPSEIERKFLVDEVPEDLDIESRDEIAQGYLATGDHQVRLRRQGDRPLLTAKRGGGLVRDEVEVLLEEESFERLWPLTEGRRLRKERLTATVDDQTVSVDVYRGSLAGLIVVEVEFEDLDAARAFVSPRWFGRELTDDARYSNQRLALEGLPVVEE
jgi:CYTH domain-containing protein